MKNLASCTTSFGQSSQLQTQAPRLRSPASISHRLWRCGGRGGRATSTCTYTGTFFVKSQHLAEVLEGDSPNVKYRVRIDFAKLLLLAHGNRAVKRIVAAGSIPPELTKLWDKMEEERVEVELCNPVMATECFRWRCSTIAT